MKFAHITHGDDPDGLVCAALLRRLFGADAILANYDNLEEALGGIKQGYDSLYITDLNLREALFPQIKRIRGFATVTIIDHHPMESPLFTFLSSIGVEIILDTVDCASALVYNHFKDELEKDATRLAAYAAISDMFEDGPIASNILDGMDRKFVQHEALLLGAALGSDQSQLFKERIVEDLSHYAYPHRIKGVVDAAMSQLEKIVRMKETMPGRARVLGRLAYVECCDDLSTGEVANIVMDTLSIPVGLCWKDQGELVNISMRGERKLSEHLGDIAAKISKKHGGFGGGHARASGAKVPKEKLEGFLSDLVRELNP